MIPRGAEDKHVPDYRAHSIGPNGQITKVREFAAADRREAAWVALKFVEKIPIELWEGDEYIGTLKPSTFGGGPIFKRPSKKTKKGNEPANRAG
jgi:hypothetical protein